MKNLTITELFALLASAVLCSAQPLPPVTTTWTRDFLRATSRTNAWTKLGIIQTNQTEVTNWITTIPNGTVTPPMLSTAVSNAWKAADTVVSNGVVNLITTNLSSKSARLTNGLVGTAASGILPIFENSSDVPVLSYDADNEEFQFKQPVRVPSLTVTNDAVVSGTITGDGSGVTNLDGTKVQAGTINSNALDTATAATLALAGTGSSASGVSYPFVTVQPDGTFVAGGTTHTNAASTTAGIQEAIHYLLGVTNGIRSKGGTIYLAPGTFFTTSTIRIPGDDPGTNMVAIQIEGAGKLSSGITYAGTDPASVIMVNPTNSAANFDAKQNHGPDTITFGLRNLFVSSLTNACTNLVYLKCPAPGVAVKHGAIESAEIDRCWFFYGALTNTSWVQTLTTRTEENLIGVEVDINYNDQIIIRDCSFVSLGHGISYACDWGHIESCVFENSPATDVTNAWPVTSPYFVPASIVFRESTHGSLVNGHQWWISGNEFIGCPLPYLSLIDSVNPWIANKVITYNDAVENVNAGSPIVATKGGGFTFVNPRVHAAESFPPVSGYGGANPYMPGYLLTNVTDFSYWTNVPIPTREESNTLFTVSDAQYKTTTGDYTNQGTIYATKFSGDGSLLTNVGSEGAATNVYEVAAGTGIAISTNGLLYTISTSFDTNGLAHTNWVGLNYKPLGQTNIGYATNAGTAATASAGWPTTWNISSIIAPDAILTNNNAADVTLNKLTVTELVVNGTNTLTTVSNLSVSGSSYLTNGLRGTAASGILPIFKNSSDTTVAAYDASNEEFQFAQPLRVPELTATNAINVTGTVTATGFVGSGAGLTDIQVTGAAYSTDRAGVTLSNVTTLVETAIATNSHVLTATNNLALETWVSISGATNYFFKHFDTYFRNGAFAYSNTLSKAASDNLFSARWASNDTHAVLYVTAALTNEDSKVDVKAMEFWTTNGVAGAGAAWSPTNVAGLVRWYDAQSIVGVNNGDAMATWADRMATTNLIATETSPIYIASDSVFGNKPCVHFTGTQGLTNSSTDDASMTVFAVAYRTNTASLGVLLTLNWAGTSANIRNSGTTAPWEYVDATVTCTEGDAHTAGVAVLRIASASPGQAALRSQSGGWTNFTANVTYTYTNIFGIGRRSSGTSLTGSVGEVLIYNSALSDADVNLVGAYLANRWNFTWTDL